MFATLVVGLPSRHEGGTLIVTHDRQSREIDFGGPQGEFKVQYAAFYADCKHEIKSVTAGYRVCLVYNLALAGGKRQPEAPRHGDRVEPVAELLTQLFADGERHKVAIPLEHAYTESGLSLDRLKGTDRSRVEVLRRAAEQAKYHLYLALMIYRQEGGADEETVRYTGRGGERIDPDSAEMGDVYEEELVLDHWLDAEGQPQSLGKMDLKEDEILSKTAFEDLPFRQEVHEATGNEGATVERWYRQAVVVWPPDRYFGLLARQGQGAALPVLEKLIAGASNPGSDEGCRTLARQIIGNWKVPAHGRNSEPEPVALLQQLERIGDAALVNQFIHEVLPRDYRGTEGEVLSRLVDRLGWETFSEGLTRFVALQEPSSETASLGPTVLIVEALCCAPGKMTARRKTACRAVAAELERTVRKWDTEKVDSWSRKEKGREGVIESLTRLLAAIDEGELLKQFLSHALAQKGHYDLHKILIPAAKTMGGWATKAADVIEARQQLLQHCIAELERLTAKPVEEPKDWAQDVKISCACADCRELQQFLRDPQEKVHRFRVAKPRRQHLHRQIDSCGCDMTHATDRRGTPQTLVCTKNRASYDRKTAEFAANVQMLTELRALVRPKPKRKK